MLWLSMNRIIEFYRIYKDAVSNNYPLYFIVGTVTAVVLLFVKGKRSRSLLETHGKILDGKRILITGIYLVCMCSLERVLGVTFTKNIYYIKFLF